MFARLNKVWKDKHVTIQTKTKLYEVFVVGLSVYFYMEQNVGHSKKLMNTEYLQQKWDG